MALCYRHAQTITLTERAPILLLHDDESVPASPTAAETSVADALGAAGVEAIDAALLNASTSVWSKVARVVFDALTGGGMSPDDGHVQLHLRRIVALVEDKKLEAQGNLLRPRSSAVRLPVRP